ncbi:hypothetical protein PoB_000483300 [Plakobranchus ocellatus]|uniref:Uncharacterized protein n=1 Tax=Plakobranchus ocellatus TaxID=259542 RepID=A0AAV3Y7C8_9GAST|nr:hypothetical protein PoB_000483300 [Plakobranchus ocellatus]
MANQGQVSLAEPIPLQTVDHSHNPPISNGSPLFQMSPSMDTSTLDGGVIKEIRTPNQILHQYSILWFEAQAALPESRDCGGLSCPLSVLMYSSNH